MRSASDSRRRRVLALLMVVSLVVAACGPDDGGEVRDLDSSGTASGSGSGSGSASASASGTAGECTPVNPELEADADATVDIQLLDYAFDPQTIDVESGVVTFAATNGGTEPHELAFLPGRGEVPFTEDGVPDEAALEEAGAFELEAFGPGEDCNATYELEPGTYTVFCIVETADGTTHYELEIGRAHV